MKIKIRSFSDPSIGYTVDTSALTCSCQSFNTESWCKHLEIVGQYKPKKVTLSARPSYSQALSGVVKGIRIRNIEEAAYWLNYCWGFREKLPGSQFRTVRRLLIGSAEDGHSIAVMEKLAENFAALLTKDVELPRVMAELIRICKVPNWWHPGTGGHDYIHSGMVASRRVVYSTPPSDLDVCLSGLEQAVEKQDKVSAMSWVFLAGEFKGAGSALAHKLQEIALCEAHEPAKRLMANIHLRHSKALTNDNNFISQAAWLLSGGCSPVMSQIEPVTHAEVRHLMEKVQVIPPHVIPGWSCDGVHCVGNDTRYMGMWDRMYAVCRQYSRYQRVSPDDQWLEHEFYSLDGLSMEHTLNL